MKNKLNPQNQFVLVMDMGSDSPGQYHGGLRVTVHNTIEELVADAAQIVGEDLGNPDEMDEDARAIYDDLEAGTKGDFDRFLLGMDHFCMSVSSPWTCYHLSLGQGPEMFENYKAFQK